MEPNTEQTLFDKIKALLLLKLKFALTSVLATAVDYILYISLVYSILKEEAVIANIISYTIAVLINFMMQKKYVFDLNRKTSSAFLLSISVSAGGLLLSSMIIYGLIQISFFEQFQWLTKLVATGLIFFYNFYLKRYAFERKFV